LYLNGGENRIRTGDLFALAVIEIGGASGT